MCFGRLPDWIEIDLLLRFALSLGLSSYSLRSEYVTYGSINQLVKHGSMNRYHSNL